MAEADDFDAFYHATRQRLLHQMYAMLCGAEMTMLELFCKFRTMNQWVLPR
jgi:hypothetical protein